MSIQIIPQQGDIFGRIGKGVGEGLSAQIPKELDRARLSKGLSDLGKNSQNLDPYEQASKLAALPGGMENINTLYPLVQQGLIRNSFLDEGKRQAALSSQTPQQSAAPQSMTYPEEQKAPVGQGAKNQSKSVPVNLLSSPDQISAYKAKQFQEPSFNQVKDLAKVYVRTGQELNPQNAMKLAKDQIQQDINAQDSRKTSFKKDLNDRTSRELQSGGLNDYKDVAGKIQQRLIDEGEYLVFEKGLTPEQASAKISEIAYDLGKVATQTKMTGALSNTKPKDRSGAIRQQKKEYEKYGFGEQFDDMATAALGITPMKTASIVDPVKNQDFLNVLKKIEPKIGSRIVEGSPIGGAARRIGESEIKALADTIKPSDEDNILSFAETLRSKRIDVSDFLNELRDGDYELTDKQRIQLQKPTSNSFFGDILFSVL